MDAMFEVPGSDICEVIITEDVVKGTSKARYVTQAKDSQSTPTEDDSPLETKVSATTV